MRVRAWDLEVAVGGGLDLTLDACRTPQHADGGEPTRGADPAELEI